MQVAAAQTRRRSWGRGSQQDRHLRVGGGRRQGDGPSCFRGPTGHSRWPWGDGHFLLSALPHYPEVDSHPATSGRMCPPCPSVSLSSLSEIPLRRLQAGETGAQRRKGACPQPHSNVEAEAEPVPASSFHPITLPPAPPAPCHTHPGTPSIRCVETGRTHGLGAYSVRRATPGPDSPSLLNPHHFF